LTGIINEAMIAEDYDDTNNSKLFIRIFHFLVVLIKRV